MWITTTDQSGEFAGERVGRVWIRLARNGASAWVWVSYGRVAAAAQVLRHLRSLGWAAALREIDEPTEATRVEALTAEEMATYS
jgi:hypothetical protein